MGRALAKKDHTATHAIMFVVAVTISFFATGRLLLAEAAFQDGISGSSFRFGDNGNSDKPSRRWLQQSRNLQASDTSTSAKESCEAARAKEEADIAPGGGSSKCTCEKSLLDERYAEFLDLEDQPLVYELSCLDQRCSYCSKDGTICDMFSYGALFEEMQILDGAVIRDIVAQVSYFETNQYIVGRPETVVYKEYNNPQNPGSHSCSMAIDGLECAVCEYVNCIGDSNTGVNTYYGMNVVCSNILIGDGAGGYVPAADFETCDLAQLEAIGAAQGVFEMYDPDYGQCFTSVEGCERDKDELEQNGYYSCECVSENLVTDGISPFLQNVELRCEKLPTDEDPSICGEVHDSIDRTYSTYVTETNSRTIKRNDQTVTIEQLDCLNTKGAADGCRQCNAFVDGEACSSCEMKPCGRVLTPMISCGNVVDDLDTAVDLCQVETTTGTPFEGFNCGFGEASKVPLVPVTSPTEPPSPVENIFGPDAEKEQANAGKTISMLACEEKQREFAQRTTNYIDSTIMNCECLPIDEVGRVDSGSLLSCSTLGGICGETNGGSVCNAVYASALNKDDPDDEGNCFREELAQGFLPDGTTIPLTRTTTYTKGDALGNTLVGRTLVLTEFGGDNNSCQLLLDGTECNSCKVEYCEEIGFRPLVDCTNVVDHPSFALASCEDFESYDEGFLLRLAAHSDPNNGGNPDRDFRTCSEELIESQPEDGDSSTTDEIDIDENLSLGPTDPSLPSTCQKAQPIVLPSKLDDPNPSSIQTLDLTNPNSNFALVSFVSSTKNLPPPLTGIRSCAGEGSDSPGLWYSLVGGGMGVHASVCREATDFEARISVYEGTCKGGDTTIECFAGTVPTTSEDQDGSPCNVHWLAEEGKTYYLRVHGSDADQTGTFNLFLETLPEELTDTCYSEENGGYDQGCLSCNSARTAKVQQFSNDPTGIDCRCIENPGTGGFHLTCVDLTCLKCNQRQDTCGFGTYEMEIKRSGSIPHGSYESFYFLTEAEGTQASEVVGIQNTECLDIRDPYQQCMYTLEETMDNSDNTVFCECRETSDVGNYMLLCSIYDTHEYCSSTSDDLCASVLFGQSISQYGTVTSEFRNYKVNNEEETSITVERSGNVCAATIGEEACAVCQVLQTCVNNPEEDDALNIISEVSGTTASVFTDLSIDCSNVVEDETDASFDCGNTSKNTGLLSILAGSVSSINGGDKDTDTEAKPQTIPPKAFNGPTSPPVTRPTNPPFEPVAAPSMPPGLVTPTVYEIADREESLKNSTSDSANNTTTESNSTDDSNTTGAEEETSTSSSAAALAVWPEQRRALAGLVVLASMVMALL